MLFNLLIELILIEVSSILALIYKLGYKVVTYFFID